MMEGDPSAALRTLKLAIAFNLLLSKAARSSRFFIGACAAALKALTNLSNNHPQPLLENKEGSSPQSFKNKITTGVPLHRAICIMLSGLGNDGRRPFDYAQDVKACAIAFNLLLPL